MKFSFKILWKLLKNFVKIAQKFIEFFLKLREILQKII